MYLSSKLTTMALLRCYRTGGILLVLALALWGPAGLIGAPQPARADCVDNDGDGYGTPGHTDCTHPQTDCNDNNNQIHPGATERCNTTDDDCDGQNNEGFTFFGADGDINSPTFQQPMDLPLGDECISGLGICQAIGTVVCSADGLSAVCNGTPEPPDPAGEGLGAGGVVDPTAASCFDFVDNDCDGATDHHDDDCTTIEFCDGFDNNTNGVIDEGFNLGTACTAGAGLCQTGGTITCDGTGGSSCNAVPLTPGTEGPPGSGKCSDGVDNDCDGTVDLADPSCQSPEKCDGLDNDGDGSIDEIFADLGAVCTAGSGACQQSGHKVCSADGLSTVCDAVALVPTPEGVVVATCTDGEDNDCDGLVDMNDAGCRSALMEARAALQGSVCPTCTGWYRIDFDVLNADPLTTVVTADLLAQDALGNIVATITVADGDLAYLGAMEYGADCIVAETVGGVHRILAPQPLLRVRAEDPYTGKVVWAYASNIPYLEVIEPSGGVVLGSQGDKTPVLVAIPLVDPASLVVYVDGVSLFPALGIDPATSFPGGPYAGNALVNGNSVEVSDLKVDLAGFGGLAANTLRMTVSGLGCGGHVFRVEGDPCSSCALQSPPPSWCHVDDLRDQDLSVGFTIEVTSPTEGQIVTNGGQLPSTVQVVGTACHGQELASVQVNTFDIDVSGQTFTPGNGVDAGDVYNLPFDVQIPVTNMRSVVDAGATGGSFDPGTNRLVAQAIDHDANTVYDNLIFAVGPVIPAPQPGGGLRDPSPSEVPNAFVLAISGAGLDTFFDGLKNRTKRDMGDTVKREFKKVERNYNQSVDDACDPPVKMTVPNSELLNDTFTVDTDFQQDTIGVRINFPEVDNTTYFRGYCEDCDWIFCWTCVTVDVDALFKFTGMGLTFDVTEQGILNSTKIEPTFDKGDSDNGTHIRGEVEIGCILGFFLDILDFLGQVITFGQWDPGLDTITFEITNDTMKEKFNGLKGDPFDLDLVRFKNDNLPDFGTRQRESRLSDVAITPSGIAVSIGASFEPDAADLDPAAADIPGTPRKNAPIPQPPLTDVHGQPAGHITIAIADDVFNQLFYSMVQTGRLKTDLFEVTRELGDFLPVCNTISDPIKQARCVGFRGGECNDYPLGSDERQACRRARRIKRNHNIGADTTLILNGRVETPPVLLIDDAVNTDPVEVVLRYENIEFSMVADRDGNGSLDGDSLDSIGACELGGLDNDAPQQSSVATKCLLWRLCLTIDVRLSMEMTTNPDTGKSRIKFNFLGIDRELSRGELCQGAVDVPELDFFNGQAGQDQTFDILDDKLRDHTPPLDSEGLELGGFVTFERDRLMAIESQTVGDDGFQDYIGITGNLVAQPPPPDPAPAPGGDDGVPRGDGQFSPAAGGMSEAAAETAPPARVR